MADRAAKRWSLRTPRSGSGESLAGASIALFCSGVEAVVNDGTPDHEDDGQADEDGGGPEVLGRAGQRELLAKRRLVTERMGKSLHRIDRGSQQPANAGISGFSHAMIPMAVRQTIDFIPLRDVEILMLAP